MDETLGNLEIVAEGKTKIISRGRHGGTRALFTSKDDLTAGNGAKHDTFPRKAEYATATTCAVFELLKRRQIPAAYVARVSPVSFEAEYCEMLPYEIVIRRIALGSYCKRHPEIRPRTVLAPPVVEFFLKTSGKRFRGAEVPVDDPHILDHSPAGIDIVRPDMPVSWEETQHIEAALVYGSGGTHPFRALQQIALHTFAVLEGAWEKLGYSLADLKIECGYTAARALVVADVIDNDSWRLFDTEGRHMDKQRYRDGAPLDEVAELYRRVALLAATLP